MPWIAFAVLFLLALFFIKNKSSLLNSVKNESTTGLSYGDAILEDLVNKDTDLDGVYDWEESLWGTDPTKKDTDDDGVLDNLEIKDLSAQGGLVPGGRSGDSGQIR
ncbi:MAG: LamG domain protein jellyroll fold domain protein [Candidatus Nomurabacteria bacterium GW2011_GWA2_40_97]|nr:MAG: LamG domain protein jellyroll fold domain protein [Candidatus Nomurabacteria bacterium GW2011_GWA2_40_97]